MTELSGGTMHHIQGFAGLPVDDAPTSVTLLGQQIDVSASRDDEVSNVRPGRPDRPRRRHQGAYGLSCG